MRYAKNRGVEVYIITWNVRINSIAPPGWYREQANKKEGIDGKYGIYNDQGNLRTIAYRQEAVKKFILTPIWRELALLPAKASKIAPTNKTAKNGLFNLW